MFAPAVGDDSDLQQSLLGTDGEPSSAPAPSFQQHQQQLIPYRPFSVDAFVQFVVQSWLCFLSK